LVLWAGRGGQSTLMRGNRGGVDEMRT